MSYATLANRSIQLQANYPTIITPEDEAWQGSPFDWFRKKPSATKGKLGRDLSRTLFEAAGFDCTPVGLALEVKGKLIRIKTSLMWGGGGFTFEQIRETDFDFLLCLGLYPDSSYGWLVPKDELLIDGAVRTREGLKGQHGGDQADSSDFWLKPVVPGNVFTWLQPFGGTTDQLLTVMQNAL